MQGLMWEDFWSNKGWYQHTEFKGQQGFGYESHPSTTTSDLPAEAPGGAAELLSSSFCLTLPDLLCLPSAQVYLFHRRNSLHIKRPFFSSPHYSLSGAPVHSWPEQSHRFIGQTWPYCVRMPGRGREKEAECALALGRHWKAGNGLKVNMEDRGRG